MRCASTNLARKERKCSVKSLTPIVEVVRSHNEKYYAFYGESMTFCSVFLYTLKFIFTHAGTYISLSNWLLEFIKTKLNRTFNWKHSNHKN